MEELPQHPLINVTSEMVRKIREMYGIEDVKRIKESLNIVEDWLRKQPHLAGAADYLSKNILERYLIIAKGSVEGTKIRLEKMLTARGMMPEITLYKSMEEFESQCETASYVPLPSVHPVDQSRVTILQFLTDKLEPFNLQSYFRYCFMIGEYRLHYDYNAAERYIVDLKNVHIGILSKLNPIVLRKSEVLCSEGYGTKIKGIHILNAPGFVDKFVYVLKQALREKVANRVHVHNSFEDLHKHIPKEILPKEYGGDEKSYEKLNEEWIKVLKSEEARRIIKNTDKIVSDESKRQVDKFNEEYMGMPGSFRTLTVD